MIEFFNRFVIYEIIDYIKGVIIMKRKYESPMAYEQIFVPNEYVSACFYLACEREKRPDLVKLNRWQQNEFGIGVDHAKDYKKNSCTDPNASRIISDSGLLSDAQVGEYNWNQGWITGGIDDCIHKDAKSNKLKAGDIIYWHTLSTNKTQRWNHVGTLKAEDPKNPNHS